jgi:hypothetical protein
MATAFLKGAPGNSQMEFTPRLAGRGGRRRRLEFTRCLATAFVIRAPGNFPVEFIGILAGRGGRMLWLEFNRALATALGNLIAAVCIQAGTPATG